MMDLDRGTFGVRSHGEVLTKDQNKFAVLTIEDDPSVADLLGNVLKRDGYTVVVAPDGLPDLDGWEVCRRLRNSPRTQFVPLIMLTADGSEADRVLGLELGADDYVSKPFSPRELRARVRALLRRAGARSKPDRRIRHGDLSIDADRREVTYAGQTISLTATEFLILQLLATSPGRVLSRPEISSLLREGDSAALDRAVDAHIKSIRKALGSGGGEVETVRGFGYRLRDQAKSQGSAG